MYAEDEDGNPWSPGWFTLNFKASYNVSNRLDLTAGVENILDLRYRPYSSGIAAPGRSFIISARIRILTKFPGNPEGRRPSGIVVQNPHETPEGRRPSGIVTGSTFPTPPAKHLWISEMIA